ncbi:MAG: hypothetical protein IJU41_03610 [Clostridia bacterium]|nr:hypothetical protein [Clostridia bacterium]
MSVSLIWKKHLSAPAISACFAGDRTKIFANTELWRLCSPYVPMRTGTLMSNVEITPEHLRYKAPYAARMYYGEGFNFRRDKHPLATAKWDEAAMQTQKDKLVRAVTEFMRRQAR